MAVLTNGLSAARRIMPLPAGVAAQVQSSATITSLPAVVFGLVKNSLDAGARHIELEINSLRGDCSIKDDGMGILEEDFGIQGGLALPNYTSKHGALTPVHGTQGIFLFSLVQLALVTITSRHSSALSAGEITWHHGKRIHTSRREDLLAHAAHGTKITVRNLFSGLPVRLKSRIQLAPELLSDEWDEARDGIVRLLLAWQKPVDLSMRDMARLKELKIRMLRPSPAISLEVGQTDTKEKQLRLATLRILSQSGLIEPDSWRAWMPVSGSSAQYVIRGCISLDPAPRKDTQFISFGIFPVSNSSHSFLYEDINRIFAQSDFGIISYDIDGLDSSRTAQLRPQSSQAKKSKKSVNRWPMFYFNISRKTLSSHQENTERQLMDSDAAKIEEIQLLTAAVITLWLSENHFTPRKTRQGHPAKALTEIQAPQSSIPSSRISRLEALSSQVTDIKPTRLSDKTMPFRSWSRIKSADPRYYDYIWTHKGNLNGRCASPETAIASESTGLVKTQDSPLTPPSDPHAPGLLSEQVSDSHGSLPGSDIGDYALWTDPETKESYRIDLRTGIIRDTASSTGRPSSSLISSRPRITRTAVQKAGTTSNPISSTPWIDSLLESWQNPIFHSTEKPVLRMESFAEHCCDATKGQSSYGKQTHGASIHNTRLSIQGLQDAQVVSQVDNKFILVKLSASKSTPSLGGSGDAITTLVLVDQHAADERIKVEELFSELCDITNSASQDCFASSSNIERLQKPMVFEVDQPEAELLQTHRKSFARWGLHYDIVHGSSNRSSQHNARQCKVLVSTLPLGIAERCRQEPATLIELLRTEIWREKRSEVSKRSPYSQSHIASDARQTSRDWTRLISDCPQGIIDLLVSRSCRSAIMFNDRLSLNDCRHLLTRLANCAFPFQCAHGRPSMVPLLDLGRTKAENGFSHSESAFSNARDENTTPFTTAYQAWMNPANT